MAVSSAIAVAAIGTSAYSIYTQRNAINAGIKAQKQASASRPDPNAEQTAANSAQLNAEAAARKRANGQTGYKGTILTGPQGVPNSAPPATKTLLGL